MPQPESSNRQTTVVWLLSAILVVLLVAVGVWFFTQQSGAEIAKDNAVADAANQVGEAANQVGDAAQDAVNGE